MVPDAQFQKFSAQRAFWTILDILKGWPWKNLGILPSLLRIYLTKDWPWTVLASHSIYLIVYLYKRSYFGCYWHWLLICFHGRNVVSHPHIHTASVKVIFLAILCNPFPNAIDFFFTLKSTIQVTLLGDMSNSFLETCLYYKTCHTIFIKD